MVATARAHPPHAPAKKEQQPGTGFGRQRVAEGGAAQSFVLRYDVDGSAELFLAAASSRSFFSSDRSLDRPGVDVEIEFLSNQLREFARSHGLARDELLLDERQCLALKFMRAAWTALSAAPVQQRRLVEAGLGLVVRRPRNAVLLGGVGHRRVFDQRHGAASRT